MEKIIIAIDGYSSTGKSTIAKRLARELGYIYVDTGAMYRAVTLFAMENGLLDGEVADREGLIRKLGDINIRFVLNDGLGYAETFLNNVNVEERIRTMEVSNRVSGVAAISEVRHKLVEEQRKMGEGKGIVMDGRDIGTVVFPDAELKLFMTASPEIRATRRYKELLGKGKEVTYEEVLENVIDRDYIDSHRKDSPLMKAPDAIELDNTDMGKDEQFERIYNHAMRIIAGKK
ncbi:(d)CMP kinase [Sinomicrobium weinanense]|uniref:Cytidylate kinase n=1 Tax=Sinomicrobium weinanense TaxID=2842200 RepID=A0A926Q3J2_9FLAO|nr:(d)CMP kinase [Sinomicrobium weinanense]MBC9796989.1 (d)CMP kinase [Sinomicrobium weinanense]MBU3122172.1 (d)CMP kinase [Sinomicrobium weinanense]